MNMKLWLLLLFLVFVFHFDNGSTIEQIHLSLGSNETEMIVTWTIPEQISLQKGRVFYGMNSTRQSESVMAEIEIFKNYKTEYCTYRALLTMLKPNTTY
ncbi:hypothetical protein BLA29_010035, partial [Euroglyphus maynei]